MERVARLAPLDRPVLLIGERGTGKELIAARLHHLSLRWDRAFVQVNCAALAESLLEAELFGHEAGAFTGAIKQRIGKFQMADRGTLFLDEISNASDSAQEKVLRAVEYGELARVGSDQSISVDVRVIGATNVDLPSEAAAGRFRNDLLDRLAFDVLTVPPLRYRRDDVPILIDHFGRAMAADLGWETYPGFSDTALSLLRDYAWPGNIRELKNVTERALYRHDEPGEPVEDLCLDPFESPYRLPPTGAEAIVTTPPKATPGPSAILPIDFAEAVSVMEKRLLEQALEANRHSQKAAADHLGLSYHQLRHQLKKHGMLGARS